MTCSKCNYKDKKEIKIFNESLCTICATFAPKDLTELKEYASEKVDWKILDTFRIKGEMPGIKKKKGMNKKAEKGSIVTRAPLGYSVLKGELVINEDAVRIRSLFKIFLKNDYSLNQLSKKFGLTVNGLKKVLKNRTYLGEIKFDNKIFKADHENLISPEIFYATQRKLETMLRPKKHKSDKKGLEKTNEEKENEMVKFKQKENINPQNSMYDSIFKE